MKKFQSGGVHGIPQQGSVGEIPMLPSPQLPDTLPLTGREIATLARYTKSQDIALKNQQLNKERYDEAMRESFLDLNDKLFGPVHNDRQKKIIEQVKKENNIPENFNASILQNPILLKDMRLKLQAAGSDRRVQDVLAEVKRADEYRKEASLRFDADTYPQWFDNAWSKYQSGELGADDVAPARYKPPKVVSQKDFAPAESSFLDKTALGIDFSNPQSLDDLENGLISLYQTAGQESAIKLGLLEKNPDGTVSIPDANLERIYSDIRLRQNNEKAKQAAGIDVYKDKRQYSDSLADENRREQNAFRAQLKAAGRSSKSGKDLTDIWPNLTTAAALQIAGNIYDRLLAQNPRINPEDEDFIFEIEKIATQVAPKDRAGAEELLLEDMNNKYVDFDKTLETLRAIPKMSTKSTADPAAKTPPATVTPTGTVTPSKRPVYNPQTGKVEYK